LDDFTSKQNIRALRAFLNTNTKCLNSMLHNYRSVTVQTSQNVGIETPR